MKLPNPIVGCGPVHAQSVASGMQLANAPLLKVGIRNRGQCRPQSVAQVAHLVNLPTNPRGLPATLWLLSTIETLRTILSVLFSRFCG